MLKRVEVVMQIKNHTPAAFRRLCVETTPTSPILYQTNQPPLGGCVLKRLGHIRKEATDKPAAFRRLCVETYNYLNKRCMIEPAAFRRLCVETRMASSLIQQGREPAAFRRLCVET